MTLPHQSLINPRWPEAFWDISGIFANDQELLALHDYFANNYQIKLFSLVHGAPLIQWNCGRVRPHLQKSGEQIRAAVLAFAERNISIDLTFTNLLLTEEHMDDPIGNAILTLVSQYNPTQLNAVILSSESLYNHIKKNFPSIKTVSSILKVTNECRGGGNVDYYNQLAERFDKVMVHPNDSYNFSVLEKLKNKEKFEILLNENCVRNCPIRHKHYQSLSEASLNYLKAQNKFEEIQIKNGCLDLGTLLNNPHKSTAQLDLNEIQHVYDLGFRKFKIQGRGLDNSAPQILDIFRLALCPESDDDLIMDAIKTRALESLSAPER